VCRKISRKHLLADDTYADVDDLVQEFGYKPSTPVEDGIERFVQWYLEYFGPASVD
jgi:UDP-glucuronate 4-epimerase